MRDYRKEQFIDRFKNANISRAEAERKYKLKIDEEEELERRRIYEALSSRAVQDALQAGGAAAVGGTTESFQLVGNNLFIYFRSETTLTYQVISFNYTDNKISGPTDLGIDSGANFYWSAAVTGKGSLAFGETGDYVWYAFLDVNGAIIEKRIIAHEDIDSWNMYGSEGRNVAFYHRKDGITYLKWWNSDSTNINSCEIETGNGFELDATSYDNAMQDGTINGSDDNDHYWSFLPNGEYYDITDSVANVGEYIYVDRYSVYAYSNFYAVIYWDDDNGNYNNVRIIDNKGVILQDIDVTNNNYNDFNYGYYGDNKYWVQFYNGNDNSVPYYYIVYNGNTDTVITKEDARGSNFEGGIRYRNGYGSGYQDVANRLTNGDVIIFAPDDGGDLGWDNKMNQYLYVKFHALIGNSDEFVTYEHTNDGVEVFKYYTDLIYGGNPAFAIKQEDSEYIKLLTFKSTGAETHLTNIYYSYIDDNSLDVAAIGDNTWFSFHDTDENWRSFRIYSKEGTLLNGLNLSGYVDWDLNGSSAFIRHNSGSTSYSVSAANNEFVETPSHYIHWDTVDSCMYSENSEYYSNFFAYGEGWGITTPAVIVSSNGTSAEIDLADTRGEDWRSFMTPNYAVWLAKNVEGYWTVSVYSLDGTLLQQAELGDINFSDYGAIGDRIFVYAYIDDVYRTWMIDGDSIQYVDSITSNEANNYIYTESNDWTFNDCD